MTTEDKVRALDVMFTSDAWSKIIVPGAEAVIKLNTEMWLNPSRRPASEKDTTETELRCRILAMRWLLNWVNARNSLVNQLQAARDVQDNMEHYGEGGSPYA
jgi:hypothetical protein